MLCQYNCDSDEKLSRHIEDKHFKKRCVYCQKDILNEQLYDNHLRYCSRQLTCQKCFEIVEEWSEFREHSA